MITIKFTCDECGVKDEKVEVTAREESDNVIEWVESVVISAITFRHAIISPNCKATELTNLKIPMDDKDPTTWVGKQTDHIPPDG